MAEAARPCRYCVADWAPFEIGAGECECRHRDDPRVYGLARAIAAILQQCKPTDQQIAWFLSNADEVVDDFETAPDRWRVHRLPACRNDPYDGIEIRLRINGVTYVGLDGGKDSDGPLLKLADFRRSQLPAEQPEGSDRLCGEPIEGEPEPCALRAGHRSSEHLSANVIGWQRALGGPLPADDLPPEGSDHHA